MEKEKRSHVVDKHSLPNDFPTHHHQPAFWEQLGRTIATFGFLEEALCKAIFALTATTHYSEEEIESEFKKWLPKLEKSLSDTVGGLIDSFEKAVHDNQDSTLVNPDELLDDLRSAGRIRNVLCHGSWRNPDSTGSSIPFFVNRQQDVLNTPVDTLFLEQTRKHTVDLICSVIDTVTHMGWQFPGSQGPGEVIWKRED